MSIGTLVEEPFDITKCDINTTDCGNYVLVEYKRIECNGSEKLRPHLYSLVEKEKRPIMIDFTQMNALNSHEIGIIAGAQKKAIEKNNKIIVLAPEYIARVINDYYNLHKVGVVVFKSPGAN
jgi:hypothetical protein